MALVGILASDSVNKDVRERRGSDYSNGITHVLDNVRLVKNDTSVPRLCTEFVRVWCLDSFA